MKPILFNLQTAYEYRGKEIQDLRNALRLSELQNTVQKQSFEQQLADAAKRYKGRFWKGFKTGTLTGFAAGFLSGTAAQ